VLSQVSHFLTLSNSCLFTFWLTAPFSQAIHQGARMDLCWG
jgi:hypothetical protein